METTTIRMEVVELHATPQTAAAAVVAEAVVVTAAEVVTVVTVQIAGEPAAGGEDHQTTRLLGPRMGSQAAHSGPLHQQPAQTGSTGASGMTGSSCSRTAGVTLVDCLVLRQ